MTTAVERTPRAPVDRALLLVVPAAAFMLLLFVYPFLYGLLLSFNPKEGGWLANYRFFFTTDNEWPTIWTTLKRALRQRSARDRRRSSATSTCRSWHPGSRCVSASPSFRPSRCFLPPSCWARPPGPRG